MRGKKPAAGLSRSTFPIPVYSAKAAGSVSAVTHPGKLPEPFPENLEGSVEMEAATDLSPWPCHEGRVASTQASSESSDRVVGGCEISGPKDTGRGSGVLADSLQQQQDKDRQNPNKASKLAQDVRVLAAKLVSSVPRLHTVERAGLSQKHP